MIECVVSVKRCCQCRCLGTLVEVVVMNRMVMFQTQTGALMRPTAIVHKRSNCRDLSSNGYMVNLSTEKYMQCNECPSFLTSWVKLSCVFL